MPPARRMAIAFPRTIAPHTTTTTAITTGTAPQPPPHRMVHQQAPTVCVLKPVASPSPSPSPSPPPSPSLQHQLHQQSISGTQRPLHRRSSSRRSSSTHAAVGNLVPLSTWSVRRLADGAVGSSRQQLLPQSACSAMARVTPPTPTAGGLGLTACRGGLQQRLGIAPTTSSGRHDARAYYRKRMVAHMSTASKQKLEKGEPDKRDEEMVEDRKKGQKADQKEKKEASAAKASDDDRVRELGTTINDAYASLRDEYAAPKYPIVLAHGLLGFAELRLAGELLPALQYWHGIRAALEARGATVLTTSVPPSHSIQHRAARLADDIIAQAGRHTANDRQGARDSRAKDSPRTHADETININIIAHSMGGLDSRWMISHLGDRLSKAGICVKSLVTIATPHHGSYFSDYLIKALGQDQLHMLYQFLEIFGLGTEAFEQLSQRYMQGTFNPNTPDSPDVEYFSFGAMVEQVPLLSPFRLSRKIIYEHEGANDGMVSVTSAKWGTYKGTLVGVSHLDLINWTNKVRWTVRRWMGEPNNFNALALYLDVAEMLAKEGF